MTLEISPQADRVAVVTGAASGLGRGYAERLAHDGAQVVIADRDPADEAVAAIEAAGGRARSIQTDVTDPEAAGRLAAEVQQAFGRCDILVNNAGAYPYASFDEMTFEQWRSLMTLNLDGPFLMCKAFVPMMRAAKYGRIVNIASSECWMLASNNVHYIASKMGVVGLSRALANEVAEDGITVNVVAPGIVQGTMVDKTAPEYLKSVPQLQAIKKPAEVEDVAAVVAFLASEGARHMTAQTLIVDGGQIRL